MTSLKTQISGGKKKKLFFISFFICLQNKDFCVFTCLQNVKILQGFPKKTPQIFKINVLSLKSFLGGHPVYACTG